VAFDPCAHRRHHHLRGKPHTAWSFIYYDHSLFHFGYPLEVVKEFKNEDRLEKITDNDVIVIISNPMSSKTPRYFACSTPTNKVV
jgi:hypothetical protein